eukprot:maker-scaffold79_size400133-snap-gene-3.17 protein:Tk03966 transcript:maker-scaffold79_size400133-snap-gene-3.17-mRNA-1 annotation:"polypeptide n-acetylgalactosaminyltransferase 5 isoform x1"
MLNRWFIRFKHSKHRAKVPFIAFTWVLVYCLWSSSQKFDHPGLESFKDSSLSKVHERIREWHAQDKDHSPTLTPQNDPKWAGYPDELLFPYQEPPDIPSNPGSPGDLGQPVVIPDHLTKRAKEMKSLHQLNLVASDLMPLDRALPELRNAQCRIKSYPKRLPQASVIIIFHNEARSTLLRTVHSVINRSPRALLKEIVLVDDNSDLYQLKSSLDDYVSKLAVPTSVVRTGKREGLIRARLIGAESTTGSVMIFLDAHIEVAKGWLTPLVAEIANDRTRVVMPTVDDISDNTFEYEAVDSEWNVGGLDRKLMHFWVEPRPFFSGQTTTDAFPTPTMIGCAFGVDRDYFYAVGSYDKYMEIWGGENVEMSIRVWRCGGSLLLVPCSHLGHVFRTVSPYSNPEGSLAQVNTGILNTARFAEVWLDDYKRFYYFQNPQAKSMHLINLSGRKQLIQDLQCHNFNWFLEHVYPDSGFPRGEDYFGQIEHVKSSFCLDGMSTYAPPGMRQCHGLGTFQSILLTKNQAIRSGSRCLQPASTIKDNFSNVTFSTCSGSEKQKWNFEAVDKSDTDVIWRIQHIPSHLCLTFDSDESVPKEVKKSILSYLANMAQDIIKNVPAPVLQQCQEDLRASQQGWMLNNRAQWNTTSEENLSANNKTP